MLSFGFINVVLFVRCRPFRHHRLLLSPSRCRRPLLFTSSSLSLPLLSFAVSPAPPYCCPSYSVLGAAPLCATWNARSPQQECGLARFICSLVSDAPPPLHVASDPFTYIPNPLGCCSIISAPAAAYPPRSDSDPFTSVAYSRLSGRGGVCTLCLILSSSYRSLGLMPHLNVGSLLDGEDQLGWT